jgi:hypothetical protein
MELEEQARFMSVKVMKPVQPWDSRMTKKVTSQLERDKP